MSDLVNHPPHYTAENVECIEAIQAALGPAEFRGYLRGNVLKYLWRCDKKGNFEQDIAKASWYLDKLHAYNEKERK